MSFKSWKVVPFVACLSIAAACATTPEQGTGMEGATTPASGSMAGTMATVPKTGNAGAGNMVGASGGAAGMKSSSAAGTGGAAGGGAAGPMAVAIIEPFMAMASGMTGAAGTSAGAAGATAAAGSGGQAAKAGTGATGAGGTGGMSTSTTAGSGGKAGAGGTGTGAGVAAVSGKATFTKVGTTEVDVAIEVMGCEDGKSYPVHIHEGTSCDSVMAQGGHWGAPAMMAAAAPSAAGASGGAAGSAGHDASHAAGSGGSAAGAAGMAAGPVTSFKYRGEGINDIKCTGTMGTTSAKRNSFDKTVLWTLGTGAESDVVGHVIVVHDGAARIACGKIEMK